MRNIKWLLALFSLIVLYACGEDKLDSNSIFKNDESTAPTALDRWLVPNYLLNYNIDFKYKYDNREADITYNLVPAEYDKAVALAILMKHVWLDAYVEVAGVEFLRTYCPRIMQLIGSAAYNAQGSEVLGTAEGGLKITLYKVNIIDINNPIVDVDSPFPNTASNDMNYWFFHTMHHEFAHILQQTKDYDPDFDLISAGNYRSSDWVNLDDPEAPQYGFVSGYASGQASEDMVEVISIYVTHTEEAWQKLLAAGVVNGDDSGKQTILRKLAYVREYLSTSWSIDIDRLRDVVIRRSREASALDLRTLK
ncbi:MAG: putative zinc-binding metallopeptidase [Mediterranea sp.]|nr:putative zinc-binding metallopeptidase [Mediterranea sp.]